MEASSSRRSGERARSDLESEWRFGGLSGRAGRE